MKKMLLMIVFVCVVASCGKPQEAPKATGRALEAPVLLSGIDMRYIDASIRPQDDFYSYVNGKWLASTEIPTDKGSYGTFIKLRDETQDQLRAIVEGLQRSVDTADPDQQKIADLYSSFVDEAALEDSGLKPLDNEFGRVDGLKDKKEIPSLIARLNRIGVSTPYESWVDQDDRDSTKYTFFLGQSGLGMPDRDYYLLDDDKLKQARIQYAKHVQQMLAMAGDKAAAKNARDIVALETELARLQWTKVENRDPVKTYNKVEFTNLFGVAPGYAWKAYLADSGVAGKIDYLVINQPTYIAGFSMLLQRTPLSVWKAYFRWRLLSAFSPYLSKSFVDEEFAFNGTVLRGIPQNKPRWRRGVDMVEDSIGEGLGRLYVAKYFPPEYKARIDHIVKNLLAAYKDDIGTLDWMGAATKKGAQEKLAKLGTKIGYPKKWRDYTALQIVKGDLVGNLIRARSFEYNRNLNKLGKPIDRDEWDMTPQTVNAYRNDRMNEIVFSAAILQPPIFNPKADDAVNYGAIGAVIGHEISHGFDDNGSQYDGDGNLVGKPGWFTQADNDKFRAKTQALVAQYAAYEPVPGYHVNGELTLGENIADNSGLAIAHKAYKLSLAGKEAPVIDGLTGEQRFFMGWAQFWREKEREDQLIVRIKSNEHSPSQIRGTVPEMNMASFYAAFGVKAGDKMYIAPDKRVTIW
jgi:predicted metalloendopeptidase